MTTIREIRDEADFTTVIGGDTPVLVDFWAPWCGPCRLVAPSLVELAQELDGRVQIAKVNVDELPGIAGNLGIQGIPTLSLFSGGREIDRMVGAAPKAALKRWLEERAA